MLRPPKHGEHTEHGFAVEFQSQRKLLPRCRQHCEQLLAVCVVAWRQASGRFQRDGAGTAVSR